MRKFGAILLSAVMLASMAACGAAQPQQADEILQRGGRGADQVGELVHVNVDMDGVRLALALLFHLCKADVHNGIEAGELFLDLGGRFRLPGGDCHRHGGTGHPGIPNRA